MNQTSFCTSDSTNVVNDVVMPRKFLLITPDSCERNEVTLKNARSKYEWQPQYEWEQRFHTFIPIVWTRRESHAHVYSRYIKQIFSLVRQIPLVSFYYWPTTSLSHVYCSKLLCLLLVPEFSGWRSHRRNKPDNNANGILGQSNNCFRPSDRCSFTSMLDGQSIR